MSHFSISDLATAAVVTTRRLKAASVAAAVGLMLTAAVPPTASAHAHPRHLSQVTNASHHRNRVRAAHVRPPIAPRPDAKAGGNGQEHFSAPHGSYDFGLYSQ